MESFDTIVQIANHLGGFALLGILALAVYLLIKKSNSANSAEATVYQLMSEEVKRLSAALEIADKQLKKLREDCEAEHRKRDKEIHDLRLQVKELQTKLLGDL